LCNAGPSVLKAGGLCWKVMNVRVLYWCIVDFNNYNVIFFIFPRTLNWQKSNGIKIADSFKSTNAHSGFQQHIICLIKITLSAW
jgi:hypothetical protein